MRVRRDECGAAPECEGQGTGDPRGNPSGTAERFSRELNPASLCGRRTLWPLRKPKLRVADLLARSPPTKANPVQSPAGSLPDFCKWESCWTMPLVGGFSWGSPVAPAFIPVLLHAHLASPPSALKTSLLRATQISSLNQCFA
ncbi:hypothetical protein PR048_011589 [Dryococelus australis]|uniref:Uncharacterized protein n=1 Tax=Dryococelus australis TaxID=614101 RepID=A0ABQ9HM32_9NEOP|nr:hypothetical protein PR048_011589 [Dryococelus australis]